MPKIIGNPTVTPVMPSDWAQKDETKVDYIKNKPTKLSQFENDMEFVDREDLDDALSGIGGNVDMSDYYTKAETMTEIEVYVSNEMGVIYGDLDSHTANENNPHNVTAVQVGAYTKGEIDNFRIADELNMERHVGLRLDESLGDISAALDELHAYAIALSGGDAE